MFTSILIFTKRIRYYVFDFLKEVFPMPFFLAPLVGSAVTTVAEALALEEVVMFVAGATAARSVLHGQSGQTDDSASVLSSH